MKHIYKLNHVLNIMAHSKYYSYNFFVLTKSGLSYRIDGYSYKFNKRTFLGYKHISDAVKNKMCFRLH